MKITHFGHAAVLVESDSGQRALIDPGVYSSGFESLEDLDAILLTHAHPDHADPVRIHALRERNPDALLIADVTAAAAVGDARPSDVTVEDTTPFTAAGLHVEPTGSAHATIHPDLPSMTNVGFVIDSQLWHPGDAFDGQVRSVDVLLLPVGGPWMKVREAIDFARAVAPRTIVPIHQAGLAGVHRDLHYGLLRSLVPAELVVLNEGVAREF